MQTFLKNYISKSNQLLVTYQFGIHSVLTIANKLRIASLYFLLMRSRHHRNIIIPHFSKTEMIYQILQLDCVLAQLKQNYQRFKTTCHKKSTFFVFNWRSQEQVPAKIKITQSSKEYVTMDILYLPSYASWRYLTVDNRFGSYFSPYCN